MALDDAAGFHPSGLSVDDAREREFALRVEEAGALAFRVAYGVLRRPEDAEEVAQEAVVKAHRSLGSLRDRERFRGWVVRMSFRMALDRQRSDRRRLLREGRALAGRATEEPLESALERRERQRHVHAAVAALPARLRLVVLLAAIEEHDLAEVARLLELPVGTVKSRLHRARSLLAEKLRWLVKDA